MQHQHQHTMPFSLRSDEELIAEAQRALEALGVEVVIDRTSSTTQQVTLRNQLWDPRKLAIVTSRALVDRAPFPSTCGAILVPSLRGAQSLFLPRNQPHLEVAAAAAAWWRRISTDPRWRTTTFTCCACRQHAPVAGLLLPCQQCFADICMPCIKRSGHLFKCPECSAWHLQATLPLWGVPWDMPRAAPTRREAATAATPPSASALPRRMAAAVGPDGWLRLPPQHRRMHPVDVLVDGVLSALDGNMTVLPSVRGHRMDLGNGVTFTRLPLSDSFRQEGVTLDTVRLDLKRTVDRLMREASTQLLREACVQVFREVARVHPLMDKPVLEVATFVVRSRRRSGSAAGSSNAPSSAKEHVWELVQAAPYTWPLPGHLIKGHSVSKVAYLEPERLEVPPAVQRVLSDAHARLGGAACGAKEVALLSPDQPAGLCLSLILDQWGKLVGHGVEAEPPRHLLSNATCLLHQTHTAGVPLHLSCWDAEAMQRAGVEPLSRVAVLLQARVWRLEGLAWQQRQQRRQGKELGNGRWERRGGAGRRGRRRREPGVVFELGPWGEGRRALSHEEAASELAALLRQAGIAV